MTEINEQVEEEPVEQVEPDDETDDPDAPDDEPEPSEAFTAPQTAAEGPRDDREVDAVYAKLATKAKNYAKGVTDLEGIDGLPLQVCELCSDAFPGFRWAQPQTDAAIGAVNAFHGTMDLESLNQVEWATRCSSCAGRGWVKTASLVPGNEAIVCRKCQGSGYVVLDQDSGLVKAPESTNGATTTAPLPGVNTDDPRVKELAAQGWTMIPPQNLATVGQ